MTNQESRHTGEGPTPRHTGEGPTPRHNGERRYPVRQEPKPRHTGAFWIPAFAGMTNLVTAAKDPLLVILADAGIQSGKSPSFVTPAHSGFRLSPE